MQKNKLSSKWTAIIIAAITGGAIQGIAILLEMFIPKYWHTISIMFAIIGGFIMYYVLRKAEKMNY